MSEELSVERSPAARKSPSRLKKVRYRLTKQGKIAATILLVLAVLIPTSLAVGLGSSLEQAKAELNQMQQRPPAADGGIWYPPEPEGSGPQGDKLAVPAAGSGENGAPGPELPAYQELYPELYAETHQWNTVDKSKVCYLTFDDGPSARTPEVLKILEEYGVKATFFVVGKDTEQSKQWMRDIVAAGHTIGVHSYTHTYRKIYDSVEAYLDDFAKEYALIEEVTGIPPQIFRFPGGSINAYNGHIYQEIVSEMTRRGFVYFDWNRQSGDAVRNPPAAATLAQNALDKLGASSRVILLMHDSKGHYNTVSALPAIIEGYQNAGYTLEALTPEVRPIVYAYPNP